MLVVTQEIAARGCPLACQDHVLVGAVRVHHVFLIALLRAARRLKNNSLAVRRPVGLAIGAPRSELLQIVEVARLLRQQ